MNSVRHQFRSLKRSTQPDQDYKHNLWLKLSSTIDTTYRVEGRAMHWRLAIAPVGALVVVLLMGTGVYAYESPVVAEGHPLYGIKRGMEQMQHAFVPKTVEAEARFQGWVAERRIEEVDRKAKHVPMELKQQIVEIHTAIETQDLSEEEKRRLFRQEVEALLDVQGEVEKMPLLNKEKPLQGLPFKALQNSEHSGSDEVVTTTVETEVISE